MDPEGVRHDPRQYLLKSMVLGFWAASWRGRVSSGPDVAPGRHPVTQPRAPCAGGIKWVCSSPISHISNNEFTLHSSRLCRPLPHKGTVQDGNFID